MIRSKEIPLFTNRESAEEQRIDIIVYHELDSLTNRFLLPHAGRERYTIEAIVRNIEDEYCSVISSTVGQHSWFTLRKIDCSIDFIKLIEEILLAKVIFYQKICVGNQVSLA